MAEEIILASASPRRRELLSQIGIAHRVVPSQVEEILEGNSPVEIVQNLARQKAEDVALSLKLPGKLVLGADTVVVHDNQILGKPMDNEEAFRMLKGLQGNMHQVYTGVALVKYRETLESYVFYEETRVYVYPMTNEEIQAYIDSMDGRDKAGGYGIQGPFAAYIQGIEGDYYNVMGLPIGRLYQELKRREDYGNV
ncbi:MAG: Maf family protein [Lachnospiraceae bacterium]